PGEGQLDVVLVGLTGADHPAVRPHRHTRRVGRFFPLQLLDHVRVRLLHERADASKRPAPPVVYRPGRRLAFLRSALLHELACYGVPGAEYAYGCPCVNGGNTCLRSADWDTSGSFAAT